MSGHSKWATIKHQKGAKDAKRGKLFAKLARQIEVAARAGGGDPSSNATLRTAILKAKAGQMTNEAIDRAVKRGSGTDDGGNYEAITYEGYAPGGVAMMVDTLTDNRNRTGANVRIIFSKLGGSMAEPGAVGWQFSRKGVIHVDGTVDEDELMMAALDAGADDISRDGDDWRVLSAPNVVYDVQAALESAGIAVKSAESTMVSSIDVAVTDVGDAKKILRIIDALEDDDDVQDVYSNFDISDDVMEMAGE
jgi:YebC/PmpR family DNA-binding regulatory protein